MCIELIAVMKTESMYFSVTIRKKSDNFDQYSDEDVQNNSVSGCSVSEINSEYTSSEYSTYSDTMSACSACFVYSPHSQLFVCVKENCGYALQQTVPVLSPSLFYRREKVFCGSCAFRGVHSPHKKFMKPAEPLAIPVIDYLSASESVYEWHSRLSMLNQTVRTLNDFRVQGYSYVKEQADKLLTAYSDVSRAVADDIKFKENEGFNIRNSRQTEHRIRMGIPCNQKDDENASLSSISSSSRKSSISSVTSTNTVLQVSVKTESETTVNGDREIATKPTNFVEETVRQTNIVMSRRFDVLRRFSTVAEAALQVADLLDSRIKCINHKKEVVSYLEKTYSIIWPSVVVPLTYAVFHFQAPTPLIVCRSRLLSRTNSPCLMCKFLLYLL
ncbi:Protein CBG12360 [Caenorhabditis briggsae]|uniref:Protein CBG12360 n=1 Tax=Caenorhabditis briggsae TaxID=6238 RepID=A8XF89_CAEBR|nr:Protein CBG12360 [Caenorhabditis briggsae]CAP31350.2 Protein CBG12360 [Caenorhabditis briggsae]